MAAFVNLNLMSETSSEGSPDPPPDRSVRAQLAKLGELQKTLESFKSCNCPEDCRGISTTPVPESARRNLRGNSDNNDLQSL